MIVPGPRPAAAIAVAILIVVSAENARAQQALPDAMLDSAYEDAEHGAWEASARVWRRILDIEPNIVAAAANTLRGTAPAIRPLVERVFLAAPPSIGGRLAQAQLDLEWGSPSAGWSALRDLPPTSATLAAWIEFGGDAEDAGASLVARDAFAAVLGSRPSADLIVRAASAALGGGDTRGALGLLERLPAGPATTSSSALRVRALARLGRAAEAERTLDESKAVVDTSLRADLEREVTWGYVRAGDIAHARDAAQRFGLASDPAIAGWLALYAGDLARARKVLETGAYGPAPAAADLVMAMALLERTHADSARAVGDAFVHLAQGDSVAAANAFADAATSAALADAAPLLLATAARLHMARHEDAQALPLWRRVVEEYATAPEAPEADLEWGRVLKRQSDVPDAIVRWQHLILTYPESALVPQAQRELTLVKAAA